MPTLKSPANSSKEVGFSVTGSFLNAQIRRARVQIGENRLQRDALLALHERSVGGIAIHLPLWMVIGAVSGLTQSSRAFFWINTSVFALVLVLRAYLGHCYARLLIRHTRAAGTLLLLSLLINALHWGILSAMSVLWPPLAVARMPLWLTSVGVAAAGTMVFSILPLVRLTYPALVLGPTVIVLFLFPNREYLFAAISAVMFAIYMYKASKAVQSDYWEAARARAELEHRSQQLEQISATDPLTGIYNRQYFQHRLNTAWSQALRDGLPLSLLLIDIDHFKRINDTFGHPFGDVCLKAVCNVLKSGLRNSDDVIARYGGEEFIVLLPRTDEKAAYAVAQRMCDAVAQLSIDRHGEPISLTCSLGLRAALPRPSLIAPNAIEEADIALYAAKQAGRNRVVVFPP